MLEEIAWFILSAGVSLGAVTLHTMRREARIRAREAAKRAPYFDLLRRLDRHPEIEIRYAKLGPRRRQ